MNRQMFNSARHVLLGFTLFANVAFADEQTLPETTMPEAPAADEAAPLSEPLQPATPEVAPEVVPETVPQAADTLGPKNVDLSASEEKAPLKARLPLNELRVFAEAFNRISSAYVEEIDDKTLLENAIKGMLSQLDPHSSYLDKDSFTELQESTTGNYGGLGLEVGMEDGFVKVISPMDDTPAAKAGMESGDLIVQLNETPVKGMNLSDAIEAMRGEPGSEIKITVIKVGASTPTDLTLIREVIKVASVRHRILEDGYGYLRIAQFQSNTGEEVEDAVRTLFDDGKLKGLVIDLRNNPGGVLQSAVEVADVFIDDGLIVYTSGRLASSELRYNATRSDLTSGTPLVVLINEGTASASEIVAGALQDHGRAVLMGTNTFGKGSVQTILPLNNEKAIKLTTARYFTPSGKSIQAEGIVPDIWVDRSKITPAKANPWRVKEKNLPGHLSATSESTDDDVKEGNMDLAKSDFQLNEALTLLKGLNILARSKTPQG